MGRVRLHPGILQMPMELRDHKKTQAWRGFSPGQLRQNQRRRAPAVHRAGYRTEETRFEKDLIKRDLGRLLLLLKEEQPARIQAASTLETGVRVPEMTLSHTDYESFNKAIQETAAG